MKRTIAAVVCWGLIILLCVLWIWMVIRGAWNAAWYVSLPLAVIGVTVFANRRIGLLFGRYPAFYWLPCETKIRVVERVREQALGSGLLTTAVTAIAMVLSRLLYLSMASVVHPGFALAVSLLPHSLLVIVPYHMKKSILHRTILAECRKANILVCTRCGYDLRSLGRVCPECGHLVRRLVEEPIEDNRLLVRFLSRDVDQDRQLGQLRRWWRREMLRLHILVRHRLRIMKNWHIRAE